MAVIGRRYITLASSDRSVRMNEPCVMTGFAFGTRGKFYQAADLGYSPAGLMTPTLIGDLVARQATLAPERPALSDRGVKLSYSELWPLMMPAQIVERRPLPETSTGKID